MRKQMKYTRFISLSIAWLFALGFSFGALAIEPEPEITDPLFDFHGRESGLSNLSVSSVVQDRYGFLWFGTQGGLNRYNGREMVVYRNDPFESEGLVHNLIQTMLYDSENHELWVGTYQGISRLLIEEGTFVNYTVEENGLSNPVIIVMAIDAAGDLWAGTLDGLNRIDRETGKITTYEVPGDVVRSLYLASDDSMYLGGYEGLYEVTDDRIEKVEVPLPSPNVMTIDEFEQGVLTLGLWGGGVSRLTLETMSLETVALADDRVYGVEKTADDSLWVGTWGGGLFRVKADGSIDHYPGDADQSGYGHPVGYALFEDNTGILWIGTNGGGLYSVNPRKQHFTLLTNDPEDPESLPKGKVNALFEGNDGALWITVYNSGLHRYDLASHRFDHFRHDPADPLSLPSDQVTAISRWKGQMLVGTNAGIAAYDPTEQQFDRWDILPQGTLVYALAPDREGGLWIGTYHQGAYYYTPDQELVQYALSEDADHPLSDNLVYSLLIDSRDRVWIGTNNGLNRIDPGKSEVRVYRRNGDDRTQLANNTIRYLYEDQEGIIWIGMVGGGLAKYEESQDRFVNFTERDGLSSNVVTGIVEDGQGALWMATHNGLSVLADEESHFFKLSAVDGIGGEEFTGGALRFRDEFLVFGASHGVTILPSDVNRTDPVKPLLYITDVRTFQESVNPRRVQLNGEHLVFEPQDNFVGFDFVALDYDSPDQLLYQYRLVGFDEEWVDAGNRYYASYSNLPPGAYRFEVVAKTVRDVMSDVAYVTFEIKTAWYKSTVAYALYGVLVLIFIYMLFKVREGQLVNRRNTELSELNEQLEKANEQLEMLSTTDVLTGLHNRHYFDTISEELLFLAKRSESYFTLLMIDIDGFKQINDRYGHLAGDDYLRDTGEMIRAHLPRGTDFAARYGGDEFVVVLYDTPPEGAKTVADKLLSAGRQIQVKTERVSEQITTTLSIGCDSRVPNPSSTVSDYLRRADEALYRAKQSEDNELVMALEERGEER